MTFKFKIEKIPEILDMQQALGHIKNMVDKGFLLQGSQQEKLEEVVPHQAVDQDGHTVTNMNAVYATDDFRIGIIKALMAPKKPLVPWSGGYSTDNPETMSITGKNMKFKEGYVYILPPDNFQNLEEDGSKEIISNIPVKPVAKVKVTPNILKLISGINYNLKQ